MIKSRPIIFSWEMVRTILGGQMHHELKTHESQFEPVAEFRMKSIVRFNDRNYSIGDFITLHEGYYENGKFEYTGRKVSAEISHIDDFGVQDGYVSLSLDKVGMLIV